MSQPGRASSPHAAHGAPGYDLISVPRHDGYSGDLTSVSMSQPGRASSLARRMGPSYDLISVPRHDGHSGDLTSVSMSQPGRASSLARRMGPAIT